MTSVDEMTEAELRLECAGLRGLLGMNLDLDALKAPALRGEVRRLHTLLGNAMSLMEVLRLALASAESKLAAQSGEMQ